MAVHVWIWGVLEGAFHETDVPMLETQIIDDVKELFRRAFWIPRAHISARYFENGVWNQAGHHEELGEFADHFGNVVLWLEDSPLALQQ
jgi:hypothetical protein